MIWGYPYFWKHPYRELEDQGQLFTWIHVHQAASLTMTLEIFCRSCISRKSKGSKGDLKYLPADLKNAVVNL